MVDPEHNPDPAASESQPISSDDKNLSSDLSSLCYDELRRIAGSMFKGERLDHTLQPTALVNEVYIRLAKQTRAKFNDRIHFIRIAAMAMRQLLVDHARQISSKKRGGAGGKLETLPTICVVGSETSNTQYYDVEQLHQALLKLEKLNKQHAEIVVMRVFAGLTILETAAALDVSRSTVNKGWHAALAWLLRELS